MQLPRSVRDNLRFLCVEVDSQVASLQDDSSIVVQAVPSNDYWYFALNQAREPFDDARVRQALAYAIDRDAIAQATTFGNATVNQTAIPATSGWYYDYAPYSRDLDQASALLEEAGVSDLEIDLMVVASETAAVTAAQVIAANLQALFPGIGRLGPAGSGQVVLDHRLPGLVKRQDGGAQVGLHTLQIR